MRLLRLTPLILMAALLDASGSPSARRVEAAAPEATVTVYHVSDYHSHAVPFYSEGEPDSAGLARAIGYLRPLARRKDVLVLSGGDTMNSGSPSFSDKHRCADWPLWNGILHAMAFGNHDADYGPAVFSECRRTIAYPILSANTLGPDGRPLFAVNGKDYAVLTRAGVRIGIFALAGKDFERLVKPDRRPATGATFGDPLATARRVVADLRNREKVAAVILFGHSLWQDDQDLARQVPGIDLILGTHSHRKEELTRIAGTDTWMISPSQYLTHVSQVELHFTSGRLSEVSGRLVRMDRTRPEDPAAARRVAAMQKELTSDPRYRPLFDPIGVAATELSTAGQFQREGGLASLALDAARGATGAHAALSTASAFREPIPPGTVAEESLRTALPYPNRLLRFELQGRTLEALLAFSVTQEGTDAFSQVSGIRFRIVAGRPEQIQVLRDPRDERSYVPLDLEANYQVVVTDFLARVASGYREILAKESPEDTGRELREVLRRRLQEGPAEQVVDGRIGR